MNRSKKIILFITVFLLLIAIISICTFRKMEANKTVPEKVKTESFSDLPENDIERFEYIKSSFLNCFDSGHKVEKNTLLSVDDSTVITDMNRHDVTILQLYKESLLKFLEKSYTSYEETEGDKSELINTFDIENFETKIISFEEDETDSNYIHFKLEVNCNELYPPASSTVRSTFAFDYVKDIPEIIKAKIKPMCDILNSYKEVKKLEITGRINRLTDEAEEISFNRTLEIGSTVQFTGDYSNLEVKDITFDYTVSDKYIFTH